MFLLALRAISYTQTILDSYNVTANMGAKCLKTTWGAGFGPPLVSISPTFYAPFFDDILAPKNFKPKTQPCNFWHQNIGKKAQVKC